jgi:hypothetical protein
MIKNLLVTGAVAIAVVFGVLLLKQPTVISQLGSQSAPVVNVPAPVVNVEAAKVTVPAPVVHVNVPKQEAPKLGAVTSPYILGNEFSVGDVLEFYYRLPLGTGLSSSTAALGLGTTTPCSIVTPNATTSLQWTSLAINTSTSTAGTFVLATSTSAFASTTPFGVSLIVTANKTGYIEYFASSTTSGTQRLFAPNTYLNWTVSGAPGLGAQKNGFVYPNGYCQAVFRRI